MCELAISNADVAALMSRERYDEAVKDFEGVEPTNEEDPANWMAKLAVNSQTGLPKATIDNVWIILENDPLLKGKFALNQFAGDVYKRQHFERQVPEARTVMQTAAKAYLDGYKDVNRRSRKKAVRDILNENKRLKAAFISAKLRHDKIIKLKDIFLAAFPR